MIPGQVQSCFRWFAVLLILAMIGTGCQGVAGGEPPPPAEPSPTPSPVSILPDNVLFYDNFTDRQSGWPTVKGLNWLFDYHPPAFYHVEVKKPRDRVVVVQGPNYENNTVETEVFVDHTATNNGNFRYGLTVRRSGNRYYAFTISPRTGAWQVLKHSPTHLEVVVEGVDFSLLKGLVLRDTLRVDANGPDFTFHINGQPVVQIHDADYPRGKVGFFVENLDESLTHIHYAWLKIREVEMVEVAIVPTPTPAPPTPTPTPTPSPTPTATPTSSPTPAPLSTTQAEALTSTTGLRPTKTPTATPTPTPTPTPSPTPTQTPAPAAPSVAALSLHGVIAYPAFNPKTGTYDLYFGDVATGQTRLYRTAASQPAFNANGSRIAFLSWAGESRGLVTDSVNGGAFIRITNAPEDQLPTWSPDGNTILFFSRRTGDRRSQLYHTQANVEFLDSEAQFVSEGEYPTWGLNGQVIFRGWGNLGSGLRLASADFAQVSDLTLIESETAPALSPDGQQVAFMERRGDDWDIYLINADGSDLRRLTTDPALNGLPAWSPDGQAIAFVSDRQGVWSIWVMSPDGSNQKQLFTMEGSPDGKVLFEEHNSGGWLQERISWAP
jgi:hypothetical protein